MRFENKVAFITGAGLGFGRAFARALGTEGADVVAADIDLAAAEAVAEELTGQGRRALAVRCDVADEDEVDQAVARAVEHLGGIDLLINNAARHGPVNSRPFTEQDRADVRATFDVNIMGVVNCTMACLESMKARGGGTILNISSVCGWMADPASASPYGVSKLAVRGLTLAFAQNLGSENIRVNCIAPGTMATENTHATVPKEWIDRYINELQLVSRFGAMDDIVQAMLFLCSDAASFITGETIRVSGGYPLGL